MKQRTRRLTALFVLCVSLASPAYAYLDPATGSIIIQVIIGAVGSWLVYSRMFMDRVKKFFRNVLGKDSNFPSSE